MRRLSTKSKEVTSMRLLVVILADAVVLPSVCLLWFMSQAVKNERLAMRQKLHDIYRGRLEEAAKEKLGFDYINPHLPRVMSDGFLVFDSNEKLTFPVADAKEDVVSSDIFSLAIESEYQDNDFNEALAEYGRIAEAAGHNEHDKVTITAEIAQARCLIKLGQAEQAIVKLRTIVSKYNDDDIYVRAQKCRAHLLLLELCHQEADEIFQAQWEQTYDYAMSGMASDKEMAFFGRKPYSDLYIPSSLQVLALNRLCDYADDIKELPLRHKIKKARRFIDKVSTSIAIAQSYKKSDIMTETGSPKFWVFHLADKPPYYGIFTKRKDDLRLKVYTPRKIASWLESYLDDMSRLPAQCCVYDETGTLVAGPMITNRKPFIKMPLPIPKWPGLPDWKGYFPGWTTELYIDDSAFDVAAGRQTAIYIWSGFLVVVLILAAGILAGQMVSRQMKLNRLKNDFIATVTHELKTPLASMRVLGDTLLEGRHKNQQQLQEYLEMMGRENQRLTRLIDNFLSFSRMERNKQSFALAAADAAAIAHEAVESVKTKLQENHCELHTEIADNLTQVSADHDAMVTVLVNLLDNGCKYTHDDDKQITLKVFQENQQVCFQVTDNGIGISRRVQKQIFNRFYQVDQTLVRRAEGCGLGLSIVKFIVDAHQGSITIDSQPGKGSSFTVRLPMV